MTLDERLQLAERLARGEDRTKKNTAAARAMADSGGTLPSASPRTPTTLPSAADRAAAREDAYARSTIAGPKAPDTHFIKTLPSQISVQSKPKPLPLSRSYADAVADKKAEASRVGFDLAGMRRRWQAMQPTAEATQQLQAQEEAASRLSSEYQDMSRRYQVGQERLFYTGLADQKERLERVRAAPDFDEKVSAAAQGSYGGLALPWDNGGARRAAAAIATGDYRVDAKLQYMTDEERKVFQYYVGSGDYAGAQEYLDALDRYLNARQQQDFSEQQRADAEEHPAKGAAANIASSFFNGFGYVRNAAQAAENAATGEYVPTDYNSPYFGFAHLTRDTAQGVHQAAHDAGGSVGALAADVGLSLGQMGSKLAGGNWATLLFTGANAAEGTTLDSLERGATPGQALATGTVAGAVEILTEKLPVDNLFRIARSAPGTLREAIMQILKQAGSEGAQEMISEIANNLADQAVMGDKSQYELYVQSLVSQGMERGQAEREATRQFYLENVLQAGAAGAVSGGIMGAGAQAVGRIGDYRSGAPDRAIDRAYSAMQEYGPFSSQAQAAMGKANSRLGINMLPGWNGRLYNESDPNAVDNGALPGDNIKNGGAPYGEGDQAAAGRGAGKDTGAFPGGFSGGDVRGEAGKEGVNAGVYGESPAADGAVRGAQAGSDRTGYRIHDWAQGHVVEDVSDPGLLQARDTVRRYGADAVVISDAVLKSRNPSAWALTSDGTVYISDKLPADLAGVIGYHEAVHATRQRGDAAYHEFLNQSSDAIDFFTQRTQDVLGTIVESRFPGRDLIELNDLELKTAIDELNAVVWGCHKADPENAYTQFSRMFNDYNAYIAELDGVMERGKDGNAARTVAEQAPQAQKTASTGEAGTYRAERPQNVELPTVPIINLSMQDVADLNGGMLPQSGNYLRRTATERAAARLGLNKNPAAYIEASNVTQNGDTYVLKITKSTLKKMLSASSYQSGVVPLESIAVLENLERIANNGVYFKSEGDRYGRDQIAGYDHLMTTVYIDNTPYLVDMRVRVLQQQNNAPLEHTLYHFTPEAMTLIKQDDGGTSTTGRHASSIKSEVPPSSDPTIPQTDGGVNAQSAQPGGGVSGDGVGAMDNPYAYRQKVSQARSNTYEHSGIFDQVERQMEGLRPEDMTYDVATERQSMDHAAQRLAVDYEGERSELPGREAWSGEDLDTAMGILDRETARARESGDYSAVKEWAGLIREKGTQAGQMIQAFAKYTRTPEGVLVRAAETLDKAGVKPELQQQVMDAVAGFSETLDAVGQGDKGALLELIRAQARQRGTPVSAATEKALRAQDFQYLYDFALAQLDNIALDYERVSAGRKLSTYQAFSHLFNAKTALRNVVSNQVFDLVDAAANDVGLIPDAIMGMFTGRRTVGLERSWLSGGKRAGALEGAQRGWAEVALDVDMGGATKYGTGGRRTNKMTGTLPSRMMSTAEKAMGFELNVTDEFHKGSVEAEVLESLRPLVERGDVTQAEAEAWAKQEALYRAFQDDTLPGALLGQMKDAMNLIGTGDSGKRIRGRTVHEFGLGDLVQKYTQVPGALMSRAVEFSPVGYGKALWTLARAARAGGMDAQSQRGAALAMGRATTGTGLAALFASLAAAGLLGRADDEDDRDIAALNASEGISGTQLNLSGLERWIAGGSPGRQTGDVLISLDFLEPLNALMTVGALAAQDAEGGSAAGKYLRASLEGTFNAILDTPTMQSFSTIFDTMRYHKADDETPLWLEIPIELAKGSVTGFVPGLVRQSAQAADGVYRDTYTSGSAAGETLDAVKNSLPGLRQTLPVKLTPFGEEKTQGGGAVLGAANAFLMPGALNIYRQSGVSRELERVREEAGAENIYPDRNPPKTVQNGGAQYVLNAEERAAYQRRRGETAYDLMAGLMESPVYQRAGAEERAGLLADALSYANDAAKREMVEGRGADYKSAQWEKAYAALQSGIDFGVYLEYRELLAGEKKRGAASQANANVRQALFRDGRLDEGQKKLLDETLLSDGFYIPRDMDVDYSGKEAFAITQMTEGAQKRWPVARDRFGLDAETFGRAWEIVHDKELSVLERKAALRELVGGYQGNALYKALTERT